jgi:tetraacyldisaccharide 4'-kinase
VIVMDDGFQNPSLAKDLSFVVVDSQKGFGNGCVIPAGPLREPVEDGLKRATALVLMGRGNAAVPDTKPTLRAELVPHDGEPARLAGKPVVAFAGIGLPQKFFDTLEACGAHVKAMKAFADHHVFTEQDLEGLRNTAKLQGASLITTEKDWARLPPDWRRRIEAWPMRTRFEDERAFLRLLPKGPD